MGPGAEHPGLQIDSSVYSYGFLSANNGAALSLQITLSSTLRKPCVDA